MNERIKELAFKAYNNAGVGTPNALSSFMEVYSEKLTELIIKECIVIIAEKNNIAMDDEWNVDETCSMIESDIIEHFGVNE